MSPQLGTHAGIDESPQNRRNDSLAGPRQAALEAFITPVHAVAQLHARVQNVIRSFRVAAILYRNINNENSQKTWKNTP